MDNDKDKKLIKSPYYSLEKLSEDSSLIKRGLRDLSIWPKIEELFSKLKSAYKENRLEECTKIAEEILLTDSSHFFTLCYYGRALYLLERYEEALKILNRCLEEEKEYYFLWSFRGDVYYKMGKYPEAVNDYERSLKLELYEFWYRATGSERVASDPKKTPEATDSLDNHMIYFDDTGNADEISLFRKALFYLSTNFESYQKEDVGIKRAVESLKLVLKNNPANWFARKHVIATLELLANKIAGKDNKTALHHIDDALSYDPDSAQLMAMKAILHDGLGDKKNAIEWINKAREKDPKNADLDNVYQKING